MLQVLPNEGDFRIILSLRAVFICFIYLQLLQHLFQAVSIIIVNIDPILLLTYEQLLHFIYTLPKGSSKFSISQKPQLLFDKLRQSEVQKHISIIFLTETEVLTLNIKMDDLILMEYSQILLQIIFQTLF